MQIVNEELLNEITEQLDKIKNKIEYRPDYHCVSCAYFNPYTTVPNSGSCHYINKIFIPENFFCGFFEEKR